MSEAVKEAAHGGREAGDPYLTGRERRRGPIRRAIGAPRSPPRCSWRPARGARRGPQWRSGGSSTTNASVAQKARGVPTPARLSISRRRRQRRRHPQGHQRRRPISGDSDRARRRHGEPADPRSRPAELLARGLGGARSCERAPAANCRATRSASPSMQRAGAARTSCTFISIASRPTCARRSPPMRRG